MKTWIKIAIPVVAVVVLAAWYAFRPERLVVNRQVDEAMPVAQGGSSPQPLESGKFYRTTDLALIRNATFAIYSPIPSSSWVFTIKVAISRGGKGCRLWC